MKQTYFQNHVLDLSFNKETGTAYAVWNGFLSTDEFREATLVCAKLLQEHHIQFWLADNRKMKAIKQADQVWFMEHIWPIIFRHLKRMATLVSEDVFNKMAVEQMISRAGDLGNLMLCDFEDEALALAWLSAAHAVDSAPQVL
ncbi:hypothetical protein [Rufibacter sp. LB8]|uniref:hypothetical protein n=1 Tax=Rufibacter sp. LB8 TaxID=2777781 RepID=UPI00178C766C|nr:hypothetical protein [Rufibacter sp. LB8]